LQHDLVKGRPELEETFHLQIDVQPAEGEQRLPVAIGQREIAHIERESERIEADLTQSELPLVMRTDEVGQSRTQVVRHGPEPRHRIQANQDNDDGERYDVAPDSARKHWPPPS